MRLMIFILAATGTTEREDFPDLLYEPADFKRNDRPGSELSISVGEYT